MNGEVDHAVGSAGGHRDTFWTGRTAGGPATNRPMPTLPLPAPRTARAFTAFALFSLATIAFMNVHWAGASNGTYVICVVLALIAIGVSFLVTSPQAPGWPPAHRYLALGVQAVATHLPFAIFEISWGSMGGPLAGAVLYLLPLRVALPLFGLIVSAQVAMGIIGGHGILRTVYLGLVTAYVGVLLYGLARLTSLVLWLDSSRDERAHAAVRRERQRFSRDLHDLLGCSLSAITLKAELVRRLLPERPDRAGQEVAGVLTIARQALTDVRLVASGYGELSVRSEMASVEDILVAADVRARTRVDCGPLHPLLDTVLATALREGITNILRYSRPREVSITATRQGGTVRLTMVNDGVGGRAHILGSGPGGHGLSNLRARLESIGGSFRAGLAADGRFVLCAEAPADPVLARPPGDHLSVRAAP